MVDPGFLQFVSRIAPLGADDAVATWRLFSPRQIAKKELWLKEGQVADSLGFIATGHMRGYLLKDAEEMTSHFYFAPTFVGDIVSIRQKDATRLNIQALDDVLIYEADFAQIEQLAFERQNVMYLFLRFIEHLYIFSSNRQYSLLCETPIERYQNLFRERPKVVANIPLQYIASYLGINPETLSRIRRKMAHASADKG